MSEPQLPDFQAFMPEQAPEDETDKLAMLAKLVDQQQAAAAKVAECERELKAAQAAFVNLAEHQVPDLLEELGLQTITTTDGNTVELSEKIRSSIPKARKLEAHKWLEDNGQAGMIKRTFIISFNRDEEKFVRKFERDLAQRKRPLNTRRDQKVEPQTLLAFIRRQIEAGNDVPLDLFGVHRQRVAKIK